MAIVVGMMPLYSALTLSDDIANAISSDNLVEYNRLIKLATKTDDNEFNKLSESAKSLSPKEFLKIINAYRKTRGLI